MLAVGITGSRGLLGWHLRCGLHGAQALTVIPADRQTFATEKSLGEFAASCDVIVHFAGMNRGDDEELYKTNVELTERLIGAVEKTGRTTQIIFSSSTHIYRDTAYGRSKRDGATRLADWADRTGNIFNNLVLPNIFGEGGRPFYNSAVSTFCHQIANSSAPEIHVDTEIQLLHAQRVADIVLQLIDGRGQRDSIPTGTTVRVSEVLHKLHEMADSYRAHIIPTLGNPFDLDLFNTLRSYFYPRQYPVPLKVHSDNRGGLFEVIKANTGGQTFLSTSHPGIVRGNHFHRRKVERFLVVRGKATICIRRLFTDDVTTFVVHGDKPQYIDIPTLHTHNITNTGDGELTTLFWSNEIFDPQAPDTVAEPV